MIKLIKDMNTDVSNIPAAPSSNITPPNTATSPVYAPTSPPPVIPTPSSQKNKILIPAILFLLFIIMMLATLISGKQKNIYRSRASYPTATPTLPFVPTSTPRIPTSTPYPTPIPPSGPCGNDRSCENISDATSCQNQQGIWFFQGCEDWDPQTPDTKHCCISTNTSPTVSPIIMTKTPSSTPRSKKSPPIPSFSPPKP